mgnify:CR=1 FL=1
MTECTQESFDFPACKRRRVEARFAGGDISSDGGFTGGYTAAAENQTIVLEGVDLTAGGTMSDQQIIDALLATNNLITD